MGNRSCPPPPLPVGRDFPCSDGHYVTCYEYPAAADVPASGINLLLLHGIQSHAGWYTGSCQQFAQKGHRVFFLNRRGSGLDQIHRGDTPTWRRLVKDIQEFLRDQQKRQSGGSWVLGGISWGGKLAAALASRSPDLVDGLLLMCPGIVPIVGLPLATRLNILFSRLLYPSKPFPIPLDDPAFFTGKDHWKTWLSQDKLSLSKATARFLVESVRLDLWLKWQSRGWKLPTLLLLAGQEKVINNSETRDRVENLAEGPFLVKDYPTAHHTLEFEGPDILWVDDVDLWLRQISTCGS